MQGWITLHRKLINWGWYPDVNVSRVFVHLLLVANHKQGEFLGTKVKRGQFITSYQKLSNATFLTIKQVRTALRKLESTGDISVRTTNKFTLITVSNYDAYQSDDIEQGQTKGKPKANGGQTEGKQRATNNNDNNNNNENNENKGYFDFEKFYLKYPGQKKSADTEFKDFCKLYPEWEKIAPLLYPAISSEIKFKTKLSDSGFNPNWKYLNNWLKEKCWEISTPNSINDEQGYLKWKGNPKVENLSKEAEDMYSRFEKGEF